MFSREQAVAELQKRGKWSGASEESALPPGAPSAPQPGEYSAGRDVGIVGRGVSRSIGSIPDFLALPSNVALAAQGKEPLRPSDLIKPFGYKPGANDAESFSDLAGKAYDYITDNQYVPKSLPEKMLGGASEFLGGAAGFSKAAATKLSPAAQKWLAAENPSQYISMAGAGAGMEVGKELDPNGVAAPVLGAIAGSFAPAAAAKTAKFLGAPLQNTQKGLANAFSVNPEKVRAYEEAGLNPTLADVSDSRFLKGAQNLAIEAPLGGDIISNAIKNTNDSIERTLTSGLPQEGAGELAQAGLRGYQKKGAEVAGKLQQRMAKHLAPDEAIPVNKTLEAIGSQTKFATPEAQMQFNASSIGKEYTKLAGIAERNNGAIPYQDLVYFRQNIDDQINNFGLMGFNKEQGALKNLRTQIQADIGQAFKGKGDAAGRDFERFNSFYSNFAKKNENIINGLIKDKGATQTFRSIISDLRVDANKADTVLKSLSPDQKQVFSQSLIKELGMNPQNEFSPASFATNFKKLEPNAQGVVLAPFNKETQKQFRSIVDAIDNMKDTKAISNPSGTLNQGLRGGVIAGALTNLPLTATLLGLGNVSARLMTNPKFIGWLAKGNKLGGKEEIANHIGGLGELVKQAPEINFETRPYLKGLYALQPKSDAKDQEVGKQVPQSSNQPSPITREQAIQELERRKGSQQTPQLQPQELPMQNAAPQEEAPQHPVTPDLLNKISHIESNNNPMAHASNGSASGLYQFTNGTWKEVVKKYGAETGIGLGDKNNPKAQRIMAERMLNDNASELKQALGRNPQDAEIYLTHFLGLGGARKMLGSNPNQFAAQVLPDAARANRGMFFRNGRPLTVAQFYQNINRKVMTA